MKESPRLGLWMLLLKLGGKFIPLLLKGLGLLVKTKGGLAALSFAGWSVVSTWQFAVVLMAAVGIHEAGHVWAMRRCGIPTKGFYFLPFIGGAAVPDRAWHTQREHLYVALMGPVWGTLVALPLMCAYLLTGDALWAGIAAWVGALNLINLLPIYPLDGGRVLHSVLLPSKSKAQLFIFAGLTLCMGAAMVYTGIYLFAVFSIVGVLELLIEDRKKTAEANLSAKFESLREQVRQEQDQLEQEHPGISDHVERLLAERPDPESESYVRHRLIGILSEQTPEDPRFGSEWLSSLKVVVGSTEDTYDFHSLCRAAKITGCQRRLAEINLAPPLQGLNSPERVLGLTCCFVLAATLAALVVIVGSVDGANTALKALQ
jgi:Zn-dependent protease